jgi:hypothetical protein
MAIQLPGIQFLQGYDGKADIIGEFAKGFGLSTGIRDEADAKDALGEYVKSLYMGGQEAQPRPAAPTPGGQLIDGSITAAEGATDPTLDAYFKSIRAAESGGNDAARNPNSSATGRYQFTEGTWNGLAQTHPELGLTPEGRTDPVQQERAIRAFTNDNIGTLRGKGLPINPGNLYASHFLGAGGATDVLGLDDNTPMVSAVSPEVVQANPFLADMTVGDFKQWTASKAGNGQGGYAAPMEPQDPNSPSGAPIASTASTSGLPDRETMLALFRNPTTRGFAQELVTASQAGMAPPKPSGEMVKFLEAQANPAFAKFLEDNAGGTTVNVNSGSDDFYTAADKKRGEDFVATEVSGTKAASNLAQLSRLEQLLEAAPQGMEGGWKGFVGQFGIDSEGLDDIQAAQALINSMVPDQRPPGSGTMSDADLALFKASIPAVINQPGGNATIIQTLRGIALYDQKMGEIATQVLDRTLTPAQGRAEMAKVTNPLEAFKTNSQRSADQPPEGVPPDVWGVMTPEERALWQ